MEYLGSFLVFVGMVILPILIVLSLSKKVALPFRKRSMAIASVMATLIGLFAVGSSVEPPAATADALNNETSKPVLDTPNAAPTVEAAAPVKQKVETPQPAPKPQDKTFGITPDEFGKRFIQEAKEIGLGEDIGWDGSFEIKEGKVNDVFILPLSDALAMNGTVDKNGELKGLTYIMGATDEGEKEGMNLFMLTGLSARALSPDLPKEQTAGVVAKVMAEALEELGSTGEGEASRVVDGINYSATASKGMGLWVSFEPVDD